MEQQECDAAGGDHQRQLEPEHHTVEQLLIKSGEDPGDRRTPPPLQSVKVTAEQSMIGFDLRRRGAGCEDSGTERVEGIAGRKQASQIEGERRRQRRTAESGDRRRKASPLSAAIPEKPSDEKQEKCERNPARRQFDRRRHAGIDSSQQGGASQGNQSADGAGPGKEIEHDERFGVVFAVHRRDHRREKHEQRHRHSGHPPETAQREKEPGEKNRIT